MDHPETRFSGSTTTRNSVVRAIAIVARSLGKCGLHPGLCSSGIFLSKNPGKNQDVEL